MTKEKKVQKKKTAKPDPPVPYPRPPSPEALAASLRRKPAKKPA